MIITNLAARIAILMTSRRQPLEVVAQNLAKRRKGASWWDHARFTTRVVTPADVQEYKTLNPEQRLTLRSAARFASSYYASGEVAMYTFIMTALVAIVAQAYLSTKQPLEYFMPLMAGLVGLMGAFLLWSVSTSASDVSHAKTWDQAFEEAEAIMASRRNRTPSRPSVSRRTLRAHTRRPAKVS